MNFQPPFWRRVYCKRLTDGLTKKVEYINVPFECLRRGQLNLRLSMLMFILEYDLLFIIDLNLLNLQCVS